MPVTNQPTGLIQYNQDKATPGFTLFTPLGDCHTYLINMHGEIVHEWDLPNHPGNYAQLLENGNLLVAVDTDEGPTGLSAKGGHIIEMDWDGNTLWEHYDPFQHHDFRRLPNGNTIYLAWEHLDEKTAARIKGGLPGTEREEGFFGDAIREVNPDGELVWEWSVSNDMDLEFFPINLVIPRHEYAHANSLSPCANGDLVINWRVNNTMAIIDRETKKFKWSLRDMSYGQQHDVQMLENGNILFFANGADLLNQGPYAGSSVVEINPTNNEEVWKYSGNPSRSFFSWFISGCQRLESGNTLICEGSWGRFFEVTPECEIVWEYANPFIVESGKPSYMGGSFVFRCYRYAADSPEIAGRLPVDAD